ncbi:MAG: hypothetical protein AAFV47_09110 [Pseudomonadota bacterium]
MHAVTTNAASCRALQSVFSLARLQICVHPADASLPGSYWGDSEAGITDRCIHVRADTPLHSLLHEACHVVCASVANRNGFVGDAKGDDDEESAVCFMQIQLAEALPGVGARRICQDMDAWGYSFREGSAFAFLHGDGAGAAAWLSQSRPEAWSLLKRLGVSDI